MTGIRLAILVATGADPKKVLREHSKNPLLCLIADNRRRADFPLLPPQRSFGGGGKRKGWP